MSYKLTLQTYIATNFGNASKESVRELSVFILGTNNFTSKEGVGERSAFILGPNIGTVT